MKQFAICFGTIFVLCFFSNINAIEQLSEDDESQKVVKIVDNFVEAYKSYLDTNQETPRLLETSKQLAQTLKHRQIFSKDVSKYSVIDDLLASRSCHEAVTMAQSVYKGINGLFSRIIVPRTAKDICRRLEIATDEVCSGLIDSNYLTIDYIIRNSDIEPNTVCSIAIKGSEYSPSPKYNWHINIDNADTKMARRHKKSTPTNRPKWRILQLTDFHYDPLYEPGALAECEEPLCCQRNKEVYEGTTKAAGYWGDYRDCDAPLHLIDESLQHITETHEDFDYIYYTGDYISHMVWNTSIETNREDITLLVNRLTKAFPGKPVYTCIGNHEPHPTNLFSPQDVSENINTRWLYEHLYNSWKHWLPESTKETIMKGGYYTVSPRPGFRIISINSNDCYTANWWVYFNGTNKIAQLQWLHDTLLRAEAAGEHVHILTHVPSGDLSCWNVWSREFNRILARFSGIVGAMFNGHSHNDEMTVHYTPEGHAIAMSWNGGSLTSFSNRNSNYRIYDVESLTMQVVDHETWIFNLTEANLYGESKRPHWFMEYRFSEEFTNDLSPQGMHELLEHMADNPDMLRKYWKYLFKSSDYYLGSQKCDNDCLHEYICRISRTVNDQLGRCNELQQRLAEALSESRSTASFASGLAASLLIVLFSCINILL